MSEVKVNSGFLLIFLVKNSFMSSCPPAPFFPNPLLPLRLEPHLECGVIWWHAPEK